MIRTRQPLYYEHGLDLPNGRRVLEISIIPIFDDGGVCTHILGRASDITERKRAEAERLAVERKLMESQKLESLGVLAGGMAYDFNNLLFQTVSGLLIFCLDGSKSS